MNKWTFHNLLRIFVYICTVYIFGEPGNIVWIVLNLNIEVNAFLIE